MSYIIGILYSYFHLEMAWCIQLFSSIIIYNNSLTYFRGSSWVSWVSQTDRVILSGKIHGHGLVVRAKLGTLV